MTNGEQENTTQPTMMENAVAKVEDAVKGGGSDRDRGQGRR